MNVQYSEIVNKVLDDHESEIWIEGELAMQRSVIDRFNLVVERVFALHCPLG